MKKINTILILFLFAMICGNLEAQWYWGDITPTSFHRGDGTEKNPDIIVEAQQLASLAIWLNTPATYANYANKYYELEADIDLSALYWNLPIGTPARPFKGKFNGNNFKILNMNCNYVYTSTANGLFGYTDEAFVKKIYMEGGWVAGNTFSGSLIGYAVNTDVDSCSVKFDDTVYGDEHLGVLLDLPTKQPFVKAVFRVKLIRIIQT